jgi:hypothetical protein
MKLGEVAQHVVGFLRSHPEQEFTANILLMHLGLPLREKRRLYDVVEVLACTDRVEIRKAARKRYFRWIAERPADIAEPAELLLPEDPLFQDAGTVLHLLLQFGTSAFQELSHPAALEMLERDVKRAVRGSTAACITRVELKNDQGRILRHAAPLAAIPAEA